MPPRQRRAPAARPPAAEVVKDKAPIKTELIRLVPSQAAGYALQHELFFNSEQWVTPLYRDINGLLYSFEYEWKKELERQGEAQRQRGDGAQGGARVDDMEEEEDRREHQSPFQVFKKLWEEKGWSLVHLMGVVDGPLRVPWGESVLRGFAEHLTPGEAPLRQIGALFASFTFCQTQSNVMARQYLKLDPNTLEHLGTFPKLVSPALDPLSSSRLDPPPSSDVVKILKSIFSRSNPLYLVVPTQVYLFPRNLPSVLIRDACVRDDDGTAKKLLGIEEEIEWLRRGKERELEQLRRKQIERERKRIEKLQGGGDDAEGRSDVQGDDEEGEEEEDDDDEDMGVSGGRGGIERWISQLSKTSREYAATKKKSQVGGGTTASVLTRPRSRLQLEVMNKAEQATMLKVIETGLEPTIERRTAGGRAPRPERGETDKRLLDLVRGFQDGQSSNKRRKTSKRKRKDDGRNSSMTDLETALTSLEKRSVYD